MINKIVYRTLLLAGALAALSQQAGAQTAEGGALAARDVTVENLKVTRAEGSLVVDFDLNLSRLDLPVNSRLVFTPVVQRRDEVRAMGPIIVNGRRQDITFRRSVHKDYPDDALSVRRRNGTEQSVHYSAVVPYEEWMQNADVALSEDLCGCGDIQEQNTQVIRQMRTPYMPFVRPAAEARKERREEGRAFVDFPVDRTELHPDYRNNPRELQKIVNTIDLVRNDRNVSITSISLHGYASPESPFAHNAELAQGRARTIKDYVRRLMNLDEGLFRIETTAEDWAGLRTAVSGSNLTHKAQILELIDNTTLNPDAKEWRIKLTYPDDYRFMLQNYYPALRRTDYVVAYTVRPFSVDEAKEVLRTKPQQLSLEEMFLVAQTYEPGSAEFNEVMETAVRMFPGDPTANLNAACTRLQQGDLDGAARYLERAGSSAQALHVRGVLAMQQGRTDEARSLLRQALEAGDATAQRNLDIIDL